MTSSLNTEKPVVREQQRPPFERIALLLQGGGALGSYQAGVYEALTKANLEPDWVAGISIGAVNAALIAGNAPEKRVERLREFWEAVSTAPLGVPYLKSVEITDELTRRFVNQSRALGVLLFGAPNFFTPRALPPLFWSAGSADSVGYYDVTPLKSTLERLVDFDRINSGRMRFSVGAVNVRTGNFSRSRVETARERRSQAIDYAGKPSLITTLRDRYLPTSAESIWCSMASAATSASGPQS